MFKTIIVLSLLFFNQQLFAGLCACTKEICPSIDVKFEKSKDVYLAEIISANPVKENDTSRRPLHKIEMNVLQIFKGSPENTEIAYTKHAPINGEFSVSSDVDLGVGTRYIIFKKPKKVVHLSLCTTHHEFFSEETIAYLRSKSHLQD